MVWSVSQRSRARWTVSAAHVLMLWAGMAARAHADEGAATPASAHGPVVATRDVSFATALADGARRGPAVLEADRNLEAARGFAREPGSSLPSLPQLTVLAGARRPYNLPTGPEMVVTVQQEIALRKLGGAREKAAEWTARAAGSERDRARLEGATHAALAWIALREAQDLAALRVSTEADAVRLLRLADDRVKAGTATATERSLAEAEVGLARLAQLDAEGRATEARLSLAFAIGAPLDALLRAEGDMGLPGGERALDARGPRTDDHPAVRAAEAHATQLVHETQVLHAALGPTFSVGGSVWREGSGDRAAAAIVSVPLPFFDPARYDSGRQAVAASAAREHVARLRLDLERESRLAAHEREHSREVVTQIRTGVVTPLRQAVATSLVAYGAGTLELGVVLLARRSALAAEERLVTATADVRRADVREAALAGTLTTERMR